MTDDAKKKAEELKLEGYASLYNEADDVDDVMSPGCFDRTIKERKPVPMLAMPEGGAIGKWHKLVSDKKGLRVEGTMVITDDTRDLADKIRNGELSGLSLGFRTIEGGFDVSIGDNGTNRTYRDLEVVSIDVVKHPLLDGARIDVVDGKKVSDDG